MNKLMESWNLLWVWFDFCCSGFDQYRGEYRVIAHQGVDIAADELWGVVGDFQLSGAGDCDEHPDAAVCELGTAERKAGEMPGIGAY